MSEIKVPNWFKRLWNRDTSDQLLRRYKLYQKQEQNIPKHYEKTFKATQLGPTETIEQSWSRLQRYKEEKKRKEELGLKKVDPLKKLENLKKYYNKLNKDLAKENEYLDDLFTVENDREWEKKYNLNYRKVYTLNRALKNSLSEIKYAIEKIENEIKMEEDVKTLSQLKKSIKKKS